MQNWRYSALRTPCAVASSIFITAKRWHDCVKRCVPGDGVGRWCFYTYTHSSERNGHLDCSGYLLVDLVEATRCLVVCPGTLGLPLRHLQTPIRSARGCLSRCLEPRSFFSEVPLTTVSPFHLPVMFSHSLHIETEACHSSAARQ